MAFKVETGRVYVSGEASMFGVDLSVDNMHTLLPSENQQFLLNIMHWLDGLLDPPESP